MAASIVLGVLVSASDAESAVNNLAEEEVPERHISVVLANEADARAIIDDGGPLRGATAATLPGALTALGIAPSDVDAYLRAVESGAALIAVEADGSLQDAVVQTLQSYKAEHVQTIPGGKPA